MAYKVLGQTASTAAAATTIKNLLKDSSFESNTLTARVNITTTSSYQPIPTSPSWRYFFAGNTNNTVSNSIIEGIATPWGNTAIGFVASGTTGYNHIRQGNPTGTTTSTPTGTTFIDFANATPVTGGTTYYYGFSIYATNVSNPESEVFWFASDGTYISVSFLNHGNISAANSWQRISMTATAPSNAAYATVGTYYYVTGSNKVFWDGMYFGTSSTDATSGYTSPVLPSIAVTTAPFDKKTNGHSSETYASSETISYAGAQTVLYTVPAGKSTVVSTISVANLTSVSTTYRIAVIPSGETLAKKHFTHMDIPINGNTTNTVTIGMTLNAGDKIQIAADTANVAFTAFGSES